MVQQLYGCMDLVMKLYILNPNIILQVAKKKSDTEDEEERAEEDNETTEKVRFSCDGAANARFYVFLHEM